MQAVIEDGKSGVELTEWVMVLGKMLILMMSDE